MPPNFKTKLRLFQNQPGFSTSSIHNFIGVWILGPANVLDYGGSASGRQKRPGEESALKQAMKPNTG
jgi:hypothetical protein